jgi:hypothetical protein
MSAAIGVEVEGLSGWIAAVVVEANLTVGERE